MRWAWKDIWICCTVGLSSVVLVNGEYICHVYDFSFPVFTEASALGFGNVYALLWLLLGLPSASIHNFGRFDFEAYLCYALLIVLYSPLSPIIISI